MNNTELGTLCLVKNQEANIPNWVPDLTAIYDKTVKLVDILTSLGVYIVESEVIILFVFFFVSHRKRIKKLFHSYSHGF